MQTPRDIRPPNPQTTGKIKSTNRSQAVPAPASHFPVSLHLRLPASSPTAHGPCPPWDLLCAPKQAQSPMSNNNSSFPWDPLYAGLPLKLFTHMNLRDLLNNAVRQPNFTDKETKAHRGAGTCLRSQFSQRQS